jgi:hypothetical protein
MRRIVRLFKLSWWRVASYYQARYLITRHSPPVTFGPRYPDFEYVPWKALRLLGRRVECSDGRQVDWAWEDATRTGVMSGAINGRCTDISKSNVDRAMLNAYGYSAALDPRSHRGKCVQKSEENTAHDGRLIDCPTQPEPGFVYQRVIDNRVGHEVVDLRLMKVGSRFPLGYRKYRPVEHRFVNVNSHVTLFDPQDLFTAEELANLLTATERLGLDVGEIDVLRDMDGRVYLIDVAKTPWGPPSGIRGRDGRRAMRVLAEELGRYLAASSLLRVPAESEAAP